MAGERRRTKKAKIAPRRRTTTIARSDEPPPQPPPQDVRIWSLPPTVVTRDMLTELRDEIEVLLNRCERELQRCHIQMQEFEKIKASMYSIECALGIHNRPELSVHGEPVPWSYFHVWVARINERLEALERTQ